MRAFKAVSLLADVLTHDFRAEVVNGRWIHVMDGATAYFLDARSVTEGKIDALRAGLEDPEECGEAYTAFCGATNAQDERGVPASVRVKARRMGLAARGGQLTWGW